MTNEELLKTSEALYDAMSEIPPTMHKILQELQSCVQEMKSATSKLQELSPVAATDTAALERAVIPLAQIMEAATEKSAKTLSYSNATAEKAKETLEKVDDATDYLTWATWRSVWRQAVITAVVSACIILIAVVFLL